MIEQDQPVAIGSGSIVGVEATQVVVEATLRNAAGSPRILGQVDQVVREAYHRILSAFRAEGIDGPRGCPTINFAPAHLRKTGSGFDLPMALALAGAAGLFARARAKTLTVLGEIALDGSVLPVRGAISIAVAGARHGRPEFLGHPSVAELAALVPGVCAFGVTRLRDALLFLRGELLLTPAVPNAPAATSDGADLLDIRGHETPKTAMLVAAAGRHNLLLVGPPGSGKTALLRRLHALLPPPSTAEALEILQVHSASGERALAYGTRPVRAPHHTTSYVGLLGGGPDPRPGEVSLAHHGLLLLDELAEFRREALEGLRQPLEDGVISIGRAQRSVTMPADTLVAAAMNPCPCGWLGHRERPCGCTPPQRQRYAARISGALRDRFDLQVEVPALDPRELGAAAESRWSTTAVRQRVLAATERQARRQQGPNGRLRDRLLECAVKLDAATQRTLEDVLRAYRLSGRARVRLLRIARTLADLDDRERIGRDDLLLATRFRGAERAFAPPTAMPVG